MLFNSYIFIFIFLPVTFYIYFYLSSQRHIKASKFFIVFSSLFFYSWWNIIYLPLILVSMLFNYAIGKYLNKEKRKERKKFFLTFGILSNIILLGYFKYSNFIIDNLNNFVLTESVSAIDIALPLAISFFTFQQIAYLVDSYRNETKEYDVLNYALFVTFFPQLIAGPIVHHKEMMPQFLRKKNQVKNYKNISIGIFIFSIGLFKKVVIADTFSVVANTGFDTAYILNFFEAWFVSLSYTFQLYFDFSGYTDMAIGLGLLFNIKLPMNFNSPYKSINIQDFWRRWHITLSRFLKDYIYIPLGGNRKGKTHTYINVLTTFLLGGIWHGASWTFVFWGFMHGLAMIIHKLWMKLDVRLSRWISWFITFNFINITWVFFRAKEWDDAVKVLSGMLGLNGFGNWKSLLTFTGNQMDAIYTLILFFVAIIVLKLKNTNQLIDNFKLNIFYLLLMSFCFSVALLSFNKISEFLYFNF